MKIINIKTIIFLIILVLVIIGIVLLNNTKNESIGYMMLDDFNLKYVDDKIMYADDKDIINQSFRMIYDQKYIGDYILRRHNETDGNIFYDEQSNNELIMNRPYMGIGGNIGYLEFEKASMTDDDFEIYKKLSNSDVDYTIISLSESTLIAVKDKDGKLTDTYICSVLYEGDDQIDDHSMIFIEDNDKYYLLDEDIPTESSNGLLFTRFDPLHIIDINNDGKLELVVAKYTYDEPEYSIYKLYDDFGELFFTGS
jgi:hypothetical protein